MTMWPFSGGMKWMMLILTLLWLQTPLLKKISKYSIAMEEEAIDFYLYGMALLILITSMIALSFDFGMSKLMKRQVKCFLLSVSHKKNGYSN